MKKNSSKPTTDKFNKMPLNRHTGQPRKWVCHDHGAVDDYLQEIEAMRFYAIVGKRKGANGWDACPRELLEQFITSLLARVDSMRESLEIRNSICLSKSEVRYCYLEGIELADFIKAKYG